MHQGYWSCKFHFIENNDAQKNQEIVGSKENLFVKKIYLKNLNFLSNVTEYNKNLFIKVRSTGKLIEAKVNLTNSIAEVVLEENEVLTVAASVASSADAICSLLEDVN